jgi:hypothetical protein
VTANATRVDCGALGADPCPYRAVAELLGGAPLGPEVVETGDGGTRVEARAPAGAGP